MVVKLGDLGIAKMKEADSGLTRGAPIGTPPYMSPEQWGTPSRDGSARVDGRADVYSLAVMGYEMVAGQVPFPGPTAEEFHSQHVSAIPSPAHEIAPDVPAGFGDALARGMAKDRGDRPATAGQFVTALKSSLAAMPAPGALHAQILHTISDRLTMNEWAAPTTRARETALETGAAPASVSGAQPVRRTATQPQTPQLARTVVEGPAQRGDRSTMVAPTLVETASDVASPRASWRTRAIVAVLLVLLAAAAAYVIFKPKPQQLAPVVPDAETARAEVLRYDIVRQNVDGSWGAPETGDVPIPIGQPFRFHFTAPAGGYLYIVTTSGPGVVPKTFLTNKPIAASGVRTNRLEPGVAFEFPTGDRGLRLTAEELRSPYTVVLSRDPLADPAFFAANAGRSLTVAEQAALDEFIAHQQARAPERATGDGAQSVPVVVTVPADQAGTGPVVYRFTITAAVPK
jgi:hypothetical protein